jgi:hypothetical protein
MADAFDLYGIEQSEIDYARERLARWDPPDDVHAGLSERGMPERTAAALVKLVFYEFATSTVERLYQEGHPPAGARKHLEGLGVPKRVAAAVVRRVNYPGMRARFIKQSGRADRTTVWGSLNRPVTNRWLSTTGDIIVTALVALIAAAFAFVIGAGLGGPFVGLAVAGPIAVVVGEKMWETR